MTTYPCETSGYGYGDLIEEEEQFQGGEPFQQNEQHQSLARTFAFSPQYQEGQQQQHNQQEMWTFNQQQQQLLLPQYQVPLAPPAPMYQLQQQQQQVQFPSPTWLPGSRLLRPA
jgi:hypothetical protein